MAADSGVVGSGVFSAEAEAPAGFSAAGLFSSGGVAEADLVSSGIAEASTLQGPQVVGRTLTSNSLWVQCQRLATRMGGARPRLC